MTSSSHDEMLGAAVPRDIAWIACMAATELDKMLLGRAVTPQAVDGLSAALSAQVPSAAAPTSLIDPSTTVLLARALRESEPTHQSRTLEDLTKAVVDLVGQLRQVVDRHGRDAVEREMLRTLRSFCLALSRHAASIDAPAGDAQEHPFRR